MDSYTAPEWQCAALLTIDTQRDFSLPGAPAEIAGTSAVLPRLGRLVAAFRQAGRPIIHVVRLYKPDGTNVDVSRRAMIAAGARIVAPGSAGAELVDELKSDPSMRLDAPRLLAGEMQAIGSREWAMYKPRWGAFYATPLETHLRDLGVTTVVICGCNYPNCPRMAVYEASERDFRIVLVTDATSGIYERGMAELTGVGAYVYATDRCLASLSGK